MPKALLKQRSVFAEELSRALNFFCIPMKYSAVKTYKSSTKRGRYGNLLLLSNLRVSKSLEKTNLSFDKYLSNR